MAAQATDRSSSEEEEIDDTYSLCGSDFEYEGKAGYTCEPEYSKEDLEKLGKEVREEEADDILNHRNYGPPKKVNVCVRCILLMECLRKKTDIRLEILAIIQRKRCSLLLSFLRI